MPRPPARTYLTAASVALLGLAGLTAAPAVAATGTSAPAVQAPVDAGAASTVVSPEAAAVAQAVSSKLPVEVPALENEKTAVFAQPDGTVKTSLFNGPALTARNGGWVRLDGTLHSTGSSVVPAATKAALAFSAGGTASPAGSLGTPAGPVGLSWLAGLPAPLLSGTVATYPNVLPGADLQVAAKPIGFELSLILKSRPSGSLGTLRLPVRLPVGLKLVAQPNGGYAIDAADGTVQAVISPTVMWDAAHDPTKVGYDGEHLVASSLVSTASGPELDLTPDAAFLADSNTVYPVTVDPSASLPDDLDTDVTTYCVTCNYDTSSDLHVGLSGYGTLYRSFLRFNDSAIKGKDVTRATLGLWEHDPYTCSPKPTWIDGAAGMGPGTTWNNQPAMDNRHWYNGSFNGSGNSNPPSCGNGANQNLDITGLVQGWSTNGYPSPEALALRSPNESDATQWKQFYSGDTYVPPQVDVTYNNPPTAPTGLTPAAGTTNTTLTPTLSAVAHQPDGNTARLDFQVFPYGITTGTPVASGSASNVANNATGSWTIPVGALRGGQRYTWRVRSYDGVGYGAWSGTSDFSVNELACREATISTSTADLYGGTTATLTRDGKTFTQHVPAASWRPLTSPDEQLAFYGFPVRPTDASALAEWTQRYQGFTSAVPAGLCSLDAFKAAETYSSYSGVESYAANSPSQAPYVGAAANFSAPAISSGATCADNNKVTSWVGLQDNSGQRLIQAGSFARTNNPNDQSAFWEYIAPNNQGVSVQEFDNFTINANDNVYSMVNYDPSSRNANFSVYDESTGHSDGVTVNNNVDFYGGDRGQFITERPALNNVSEALMPFTEQQWNSAQLNQDPSQHSSYTDVGNLNPTVADMQQKSGDGTGATLANVPNDSMDTTSEFKVDWDACGHAGQ